MFPSHGIRSCKLVKCRPLVWLWGLWQTAQGQTLLLKSYYENQLFRRRAFENRWQSILQCPCINGYFRDTTISTCKIFSFQFQVSWRRICIFLLDFANKQHLSQCCNSSLFKSLTVWSQLLCQYSVTIEITKLCPKWWGTCLEVCPSQVSANAGSWRQPDRSTGVPSLCHPLRSDAASI